jgi:hypothetical protein
MSKKKKIRIPKKLMQDPIFKELNEKNLLALISAGILTEEKQIKSANGKEKINKSLNYLNERVNFERNDATIKYLSELIRQKYEETKLPWYKRKREVVIGLVISFAMLLVAMFNVGYNIRKDKKEEELTRKKRDEFNIFINVEKVTTEGELIPFSTFIPILENKISEYIYHDFSEQKVVSGEYKLELDSKILTVENLLVGLKSNLKYNSNREKVDSLIVRTKLGYEIAINNYKTDEPIGWQDLIKE